MRKRMSLALALGVVVLVPFLVCCQQSTPVSVQKKDSGHTAAPTRGLLKSPWPLPTEAGGQVESPEKLTAKNFVLIFDGSGSMGEKDCLDKSSPFHDKCEAAKAAVIEWSKSVPEGANVGLVAFHAGGWSLLQLGPRNVEQIARTLAKIKPGGSTPLGQAFSAATQMLTEQGSRQLGYGEYIIVSVTDGIATDANELSQQVRQILSKSPIIISTIGFCIGEKHDLNQRGRTMYKTADNPEALRKGLLEVLAEAETFDVTAFGK